MSRRHPVTALPAAAACLLLVLGCGADKHDDSVSAAQTAAPTPPAAIAPPAQTAKQPTPPPSRPPSKPPALRRINDNCPPKHVQIRLRQPHAAVYRDPNAGETRRHLFACSDYHQTFEFTMDSLAFPPAMDLHGVLLAWIDGSIDDGAGIRLSTLADAGASGGFSFPHPMRIGSLRVSSHRRVVWIGCDLPRALWDEFRGDGRTPPPLEAAPNCTKPGPAVNTVYLQTGRAEGAGIAPQILDRGPWLDPRSLRRTGNTVSWLRRGTRRQYKIPAAG